MVGLPVVLFCGAGAYFGNSYLQSEESNTGQVELVTDVAVKGPFRITVNERGYLDSQNNATLTNQVEGSTTIISIVPEGTLVKEGQLVCELDSSEFEEKAKQQKIDVTQSEALLETAIENLEITKNQNESDIAAAELAWKLAQLDLEKFKKGDYQQQRNQILGQITLKQEELARNKESHEFTKRMAKKGYRSQSDLEAERLSVTKSEIELQVENEKLTVLDDFTAKRAIAELEAAAKELERELDRVKRKAKAAYTKAVSDLESRQLTHEVELEKYNRLVEQIKLCKLHAPQDGEVVYANQQSSRRGSSEVMIDEGTVVRERQAIINLPDVTKMKVDARIHESAISQIDVGQPAFVTVDAFPGEVFNGLVVDVSSVPLTGSWPNYDIKEYKIQVNLTDPPEKVSQLRPGLTAEFEILVSNREDVLVVPVQSVLSVGSEYYVYVADNDEPVRRKVIVGESNDTDIEVKDGVNEGEFVVMNPRSAFADEIKALEEDLEVLMADEESKTARDLQDNANKFLKDYKKPGSMSTDGKPEKRPGKKVAAGGGFSKLDSDGDGKLKPGEVPPAMKSRFPKMDANRDGAVDSKEWKKAMSQPRQKNAAVKKPQADSDTSAAEE